MSIGQFLGNAGVVGTRMRAAEESERVARENQLKIEEQNRQAIINQRARRVCKPKTQYPSSKFFDTEHLVYRPMPMGAAPPALHLLLRLPLPTVPVSAAPAANEGLRSAPHES
jgi:hypothetical protein